VSKLREMLTSQNINSLMMPRSINKQRSLFSFEACGATESDTRDKPTRFSRQRGIVFPAKSRRKKKKETNYSRVFFAVGGRRDSSEATVRLRESRLRHRGRHRLYRRELVRVTSRETEKDDRTDCANEMDPGGQCARMGGVHVAYKREDTC